MLVGFFSGVNSWYKIHVVAFLIEQKHFFVYQIHKIVTPTHTNKIMGKNEKLFCVPQSAMKIVCVAGVWPVHMINYRHAKNKWTCNKIYCVPNYRIYLYDILGKAKFQGQEADPWLLGLQLGERLPTKGMSQPYRGWGLLSIFTMVICVPMSAFRACKLFYSPSAHFVIYVSYTLKICYIYMYVNTHTHT